MTRFTDAQISDDGATLLIRLVDGKGKAFGVRMKAADLWDNPTRATKEPAEWR